MPRPRLPDGIKPKHVLSFRATDAQRAHLERKYGKSAVGLLRLVEKDMREDAAKDRDE